MSALRLVLLLTPCWLCAAGALSPRPAAAQNAAARPSQPCPDYGSFVAVDAGRQKGAIVARSHSDCADLPDPRPRDPIHIGAEVIIGGQQQDGQASSGQAPGASGSSSGSGGAGQAGAGRLQLPPPAPVWRVTPGHRRER
ncbi:hypothetical protein ABEG18_22125 [Alsobacter sp. KACC 23698]|uniref:Uncharacterized protein n=1 Tax=Alsobacter sp. KACC 23698 TaxID=3149229 RepID=A0AAU7JDB1_9HYPH